MYDKEVIMDCKSCGKQLQNENVNFCEYCGASFREVGGYDNRPESTSAPTPPPIPRAITSNKEKPVSFGDWLGTYLIKFIPLVGNLVFFIMLIVWSVSSEVSESKKNWARANLVFAGITLILTFAFVILIIMIIGSPEFQEIINSTAEQYEELFRDIY
jgi:hypothetical protein